ncbi:MAG TPA: RsmB/NOP family class I SAM-dependent RNA methyltransferase [Saprospiraceae bacterium]|nr:RsmB/NOP family class I SAM-dependent RNA methyltransferase [Saprospiraceae bacterium]
MRFHKNLIHAVCEILNDSMREGGYADRLIESKLKSNPSWGARDRSFIAETAYDMIRNYRLLAHCVQQDPDHFKMIGAHFIIKGEVLPDWEWFAGLDTKQILERHEQARTQFGLWYSYPDEFLQLVQQQIPETWERELSAMHQAAPLILRVNRLVTTKEKLKSELEKREIELREAPDHPDALVVVNKFNAFRDPLFAQGWFEIQDASSQRVAPFLLAEPGMRVFDACAGAGGKSLHLASIMKNKGRILSLDTEAWKLLELRKRASRNHVDIIETRVIESTKTVKRLESSCDRLLLDVPCSGSGVLRRNPDAKWKIDQAFLDRMLQLQKQILNRYAMMLKPEGLMVYATCSILPVENAGQIAAFCEEHPRFQFEEEQIISPAISGFDGFYMARLKRIE